MRRTTVFLCIFAVLLQSGTGAAAPISASELHNLNIDNEYSFLDGESCGGGGSADLAGNDNIANAFSYFLGKGFDTMHTAAIVGNLWNEASLNPLRVEAIGQGLPATSKDPAGLPVVKLPNGSMSQPGWGIAQWTPSGKIIGIAKDLGITGDITQLGTQLDIVYAEMTGTSPTGVKNMAEGLKNTTSLAAAVDYFNKNFEGGTTGNRLTYAKQALQNYGDTPAATTTGSSSSTDCASGGDTAAQAGKGFIGNCAGKGSMAPIHCGQCVAYVEWALNAHADPKKGPYSVLTDQNGPLYHAAASVTKNLGAKGFTVNRTPAVHATFSMSGAKSALDNHWGHTGIVSQVNTDASGNLVSIVVEHSNWSPANAELYNGDTTLTAAQLKKYDTTFAHTEVGWHD